MKTAPAFLFVCFLAVSSGCKRAENVEPTTFSAPSFNQVNVAFESSHIECLLNQWYGRTYRNEPIVFRVINDVSSYNTFFSCSSASSLPAIDFTTKSLLVGMKADYGQFTNTPVNITDITQTLIPPANNNGYTLRVEVIGEANKSTPGQGGEWFAFTSVVPKITGSVNLDMRYQFK